MTALVEIDVLKTCRPGAILRGTPLLRAGTRVSVPQAVANALVPQGYAAMVVHEDKADDKPVKDKMQHHPTVKKGL